MVHGCVPSKNEFEATKIARQLNEHGACPGYVRVWEHDSYRMWCFVCKRKNFPQTKLELIKRIESVNPYTQQS